MTLTGKLYDILRTCELDQLHHDQKLWDYKHIEVRGGSYRVTVTVEHNVFRRSFSSLSDAQNYRDRLILLGVKLEQGE